MTKAESKKMTPKRLKEWRLAMAYDQKRAARELGLSWSMYKNYELGVYPIPRTVELATQALQ
jgi:predicted transcriptional regulator